MNNDARTLLRTRIQQAREQITAAERELEDALGELRSGPRADKTHVSARIERAFDVLKDARKNVVSLEELLTTDEA